MSGSLTHQPNDILRYLLIQMSVGVLPSVGSVSNWPIGCGDEDDKPDNYITIYNPVGRRDQRIAYTGEVTEHPGIQIRVRAGGADPHTTGWTKINAIRTLLNEQVRNEYVTVGATQYAVHGFTHESGPLSLGRESPTSQRRLFTLNGTVTLRQLN